MYVASTFTGASEIRMIPVSIFRSRDAEGLASSDFFVLMY